MNNITDEQVKEWVGHNGFECDVVISSEGKVMKYGSPDETDRSEDFWMFVGTVEEIKAEIEYFNNDRKA